MEFAQILVFGIVLTVYVIAQSENEINDQLSQSLPYPTYASIPPGLTFSCQNRSPGYYADPDAGCQVWHWCLPSGAKYSFLCPNGTVFNQKFRVCDWWFNVDCIDAPNNYDVNDDLYKDFGGNPI